MTFYKTPDQNSPTLPKSSKTRKSEKLSHPREAKEDTVTRCDVVFCIGSWTKKGTWRGKWRKCELNVNFS